MWELDCEKSWVLKNWCFWTVVLEKTLESPLFCKEIQPVHSEGDQPWNFFGGNDAEAETPVLWPPHAKSWFIGKDSDAGRDWGQEEKGTTEDEMAGWHHRLNGHGLGWIPGVGDGQGGLACYDSWGHKESDTTERLNWTELNGMEAWCAAFHEVMKSWTRLSNWTEQRISYIRRNIFIFYCHKEASLVAKRLKRLPAMRETGVRSLVQKDPLENEMATHSSVLAWRIPWTEEPGGLQYMGSQRVGHDWVTTLHFIVIKIALFVVFYCSLVAQWFLTLLWPHGPLLARLVCPWDFSGQEPWSGLPFPHPEDLPDPGTEQKFLPLL